MGCFLTTTVNDLNQLKQLQQRQSGVDAQPMSANQFLDKVKNDVCDVAETCLNVDHTRLEAASIITSFDEVNYILEQFDDAVDIGYLDKETATREAESILADIALAGNVLGIAGTTSSPVELLSKTMVGTDEWRGSRFELRYAALNADKIAEVDCENYLDAKMKDGSYRELKSFTNYGTSQREQIRDSLTKHIAPHNRGVENLKVVLDASYAMPTESFLNQIAVDIDQLKFELNIDASVGCEIVTGDGKIITAF